MTEILHVNLHWTWKLRGENINQRGNIFYTFVQILAYADAIDIISRFPKSLREATLALDKAARVMGLEINQDRTKYVYDLWC
jgi:hypothetical protein